MATTIQLRQAYHNVEGEIIAVTNTGAAGTKIHIDSEVEAVTFTGMFLYLNTSINTWGLRDCVLGPYQIIRHEYIPLVPGDDDDDPLENWLHMGAIRLDLIMAGVEEQIGYAPGGGMPDYTWQWRIDSQRGWKDTISFGALKEEVQVRRLNYQQIGKNILLLDAVEFAAFPSNVKAMIADYVRRGLVEAVEIIDDPASSAPLTPDQVFTYSITAA